MQPHGLYPTKLLCPWDFPGKNTVVGCHFLLQGIFPTQRSNPDLPPGRLILYHWASWETFQNAYSKSEKKKKKKNSKTHIQNIQSSTICNIPKLETTQMPMFRVKQQNKLLYSNNGISKLQLIQQITGMNFIMFRKGNKSWKCKV